MVKLNLTLHQSAQMSVLLTVEEKDGQDPQRAESEGPQDTLSPADGRQVNSVFGPGLSEKNSGERQVLFETEVSRKLFDTLNEDLFQKILVPIRQVLKEGHLEKTEIDEVVLVGGSTRIPRIRQVIQEFFGKDPNTSVDPDLAVVTGVAIQAGIDGGSWPLQVSALEIPNKHLQKTNFNWIMEDSDCYLMVFSPLSGHLFQKTKSICILSQIYLESCISIEENFT